MINIAGQQSEARRSGFPDDNKPSLQASFPILVDSTSVQHKVASCVSHTNKKRQPLGRRFSITLHVAGESPGRQLRFLMTNIDVSVNMRRTSKMPDKGWAFDAPHIPNLIRFKISVLEERHV